MGYFKELGHMIGGPIGIVAYAIAKTHTEKSDTYSLGMMGSVNPENTAADVTMAALELLLIPGLCSNLLGNLGHSVDNIVDFSKRTYGRFFPDNSNNTQVQNITNGDPKDAHAITPV